MWNALATGSFLITCLGKTETLPRETLGVQIATRPVMVVCRPVHLRQPRPPGFTLIEIMIVVAIMGIVLTMGVPIVYKTWHKAPMTKAVMDIMEVCSHARALAIMQGREMDVLFHPREGRFEVASPTTANVTTNASGAAQSAPRGSPAPAVLTPGTGSGLSGRLSEKIAIELMDINKLPHEFREDELARVRFFPNGTCDELTVILVSDQSERREITLEVTTGLVNVESDPRRFK